MSKTVAEQLTCSVSKAARRVCFVVHQSRPQAQKVAKLVQTKLQAENIEVSYNPADCELIIAFGGDGTILDAVSLGRNDNVAVLGVNLGHVGFLAEAEVDVLSHVVDCIVSKNYSVEERITIDVTVNNSSGVLAQGWAINEAVVAKTTSTRMIEIALGVDGSAISTYNTDGMVVATPTGSTAYAFSNGGPVVWPDVEAFLVVPIAAHALFTRPLVVGPNSLLELQVLSEGANLWCDGRRVIDCPAGSNVTVVRGKQPVKFARITNTPFASRIVRKFALPTQGWRQIIHKLPDSDLEEEK